MNDLANQRLRQELDACERRLGPDHPDTLRLVSNLVGVLVQQGDFAAAEPLCRRALEARQRVLSPDHPDTLTSMNNLAFVLAQRSDFAAAESLYRRVLAARERALGADHPDTLPAVNNLASLLCAKRDYAGAEIFYRRALTTSERQQGPEHPSTLVLMNNLAGALHRKGDYVAAKGLYQRALLGLERSLGVSHNETANARANLVRLLAEALAYGQPSVAEEAAQSIWSGGDSMLEQTIAILGSCGETPSGIVPDDGKRGAGFLRDSCPSSRRNVFQKLALEAFGPATAGIPGQLSQPVTLKHGGLKKVHSGHLESVQVYAAATKLDALRFLESCKISREPLQFPKQNVIAGAERMTTGDLQRALSNMPKVTYEGVHRFIVETPEGNWGKDNSGFYRAD